MKTSQFRPGQERYRAITRSYYRNALGVVLTYGVNSKKSFQQLENWVVEIKEHANTDPVIVLMGNKSDLDKRKVTLKEAQTFCEQHGCAFAMETSAKTGDNVEHAFSMLVEQIVRKFPQTVNSTGSSSGSFRVKEGAPTKKSVVNGRSNCIFMGIFIIKRKCK